MAIAYRQEFMGSFFSAWRDLFRKQPSPEPDMPSVDAVGDGGETPRQFEPVITSTNGGDAHVDDNPVQAIDPIEPQPVDNQASPETETDPYVEADASSPMEEDGGPELYDQEPPEEDKRRIFDFAGDPGGEEMTVISRNTIIQGALRTEDSIQLMGQITGDIDCKSNIVVAGKVRGNTTAANAHVIGAQVDGNMLCDDTINIGSDAWVLGDICAQQGEIDGKVKGNIEIADSVLIGSNSTIIGNISTDELEIRRGAFINGQILMHSPSRDVLDRFHQLGQ